MIVARRKTVFVGQKVTVFVMKDTVFGACEAPFLVVIGGCERRWEKY